MKILFALFLAILALFAAACEKKHFLPPPPPAPREAEREVLPEQLYGGAADEKLFEEFTDSPIDEFIAEVIEEKESPPAQKNRNADHSASPPVLPQTPIIEVSESPVILRKGQTKLLHMSIANGNSADQEKFYVKVTENAYAIDIKKHGNVLQITGVAPGAGKIKIENPAALRSHEVMVIVD